MATIELVEELFPEPSVLPAFRARRARSFAQLITADLHPINNQRVRRYLAEVVGVKPEKIRAWYRHWETFASLEAQLARRATLSRFCFGERPGLAEACLVPQVDNARWFDCDLSAYRLLMAVDAECRGLSASPAHCRPQ